MASDNGNPADKLQFWQRKKLPLILQDEPNESALACLAMVASFYGDNINLLALRQLFTLPLQGAELKDIMQYAEKLTLTSRVLTVDSSELLRLKFPCILQCQQGHFVVLKSAQRDKVVIYDPILGERRLNLAAMAHIFSGQVLEFIPTAEFKKKSTPPSLNFSDFWDKITGLKRSLVLIFSLSVLLQVFNLVTPYYIQLVIDDVLLSADLQLLTILGIAFTLVLLFEMMTNGLRSLALLHFGHSMNIQLGANLFHHLLRLPLTYFAKRHMGDIVSRFSSLQQVKELLTTGVIEAILDGLMAIITLVMLFFYSPMLAMVVLGAVVIYGVFRVIMYPALRAVSEQEIVAKAEENSNFMETVRGIQTIKLFSAESKREGIWQNTYAHAINKNIRVRYFQMSYFALNRFIFGFTHILVIYLAAHLVVQGGFSTGMLFAFIAYKSQFVQEVVHLIDKLIEFKMLGLHFERLADIALTEKESSALSNVKPHTVQGKISLKRVSFGYGSAQPEVIRDLTLDIQVGESVAITGPSGCGKSTLMKLMLGLNSPEQGQVLIDDLSLDQLGHHQYRQQVAAVMQDDELFSGTVAANIAFFDNHIDMERVVYCAEVAAIHDDISKMENGYDSLVGDMGSCLSGGQKQRLILARALYKQPKILFMDEATSHLDTQLEQDINQAIKGLNITRVIIAHRKETIASADREISLSAQMIEPELV